MYKESGTEKADDEDLVSIDSILPDSRYNALIRTNCRGRMFNPMQSVIARQLVETNDSMVIAAPTGSGKTVLHELAILRFIMAQERGDIQFKSKVLFIAPTKALCQQRVQAWKIFQELYGFKVVEVTGDSSPNDALKEVTTARIILSTPEKWDSITRIWQQHLFLLGSVGLLLLDEVHCLGESRGACLEAIVVRTRTFTQIYRDRVVQGLEDTEKELPALRIVALSATLPNIGDVGEFLHCPPTGVHFFDDTYRSVPLEIRCVTCGSIGGKEYLFDKKLDERVPDVVKAHSEGRQSLVFCHSVAQTISLSALLLERLGPQVQETLQVAKDSLQVCQRISDSRLRLLCKQGVAYHNSNLCADDRTAVEQLFVSGFLHFLCSTSTLAHGMNLPAYCVVIRGTRAWRGSGEGYCDVGRSDIIQMMGRAGRPGYDDKGVAVIMTDNDSRETFTAANSDSLGADVAESHLLPVLTETMCAEIAQEVITDVDGALLWLQRTFFYVRVRRNPKYYGFGNSSELNEQLRETCKVALERLAQERIISLDRDSGAVMPSTEAHVMSRHMVKFSTMVMLLALPATAGIESLLRQLCACEELQRPLRRNEKKELNECAKTVRFPLTSRDRVKTPQDRTYVLLQMLASAIEPDTMSLRADVASLVDTTLRVLTALVGLAVEREHGSLLESALILRRSLTTGVWPGGHTSIFLQIPGLSPSLRLRFKNRSTSVAKLGLANLMGKPTEQLVRELQCSQQDAERVYDFVLQCARTAKRVGVEMKEIVTEEVPAPTLQVTVTPVHPALVVGGAAAKVLANPSSQLICYDTNSGRLLYNHCLGADTVNFNIAVSLPADAAPMDMRCVLLSDFVGLDSAVTPQGREDQKKPVALAGRQPSAHKPTPTFKPVATSKSTTAVPKPHSITPTKVIERPDWQPQAHRQWSGGRGGREKSLNSLDKFAYPAPQQVTQRYVAPAAKANPEEYQSQVARTDFAASFRGSPVYQHYEHVAPLAYQAAVLTPIVQQEPARASESKNAKRPDLQLYGPFSGSVKRLRAGDPKTSSYVEQRQHIVHAVEEVSPGNASSSFFSRVSDPEPMQSVPQCGLRDRVCDTEPMPSVPQPRAPHRFTPLLPAAQSEKTAFDEQFF